MWEEGNADDQVMLPPHRRCACHTLNRIATYDLEKTLDAPGPGKAVYTSVYGKCKAIWAKQARSGNSHDVIKVVLGKQLPAPVETRWNSKYEALKALLEVSTDQKVQFQELCRKLTVEVFSCRETEWLKEYIQVCFFCFAFLFPNFVENFRVLTLLSF